MCREGGCGACVVSVKSDNPNTGEEITRPVSSVGSFIGSLFQFKNKLLVQLCMYFLLTQCLVPILSCDGWDISTIEKLGNQKDGYHPIQKRLNKFGGTQCGFCTPGMVMNMYRYKFRVKY
jgi:xanthine dehydrogenase/oxidase